MDEEIAERLYTALSYTDMYDYLVVDYVNLSSQALEQLVRYPAENFNISHAHNSDKTTFHGVKIKVCHELTGITFNLVMSPNNMPSLSRSPRGRIPG